MSSPNSRFPYLLERFHIFRNCDLTQLIKATTTFYAYTTHSNIILQQSAHHSHLYHQRHGRKRSARYRTTINGPDRDPSDATSWYHNDNPQWNRIGGRPNREDPRHWYGRSCRSPDSKVSKVYKVSKVTSKVPKHVTRLIPVLISTPIQWRLRRKFRTLSHRVQWGVRCRHRRRHTAKKRLSAWVIRARVGRRSRARSRIWLWALRSRRVEMFAKLVG